MKYNSEILRHEADHFDKLKEKLPDLELTFYDDTGSYYESSLVLPIANHMIISPPSSFSDVIAGAYNAYFYFKTDTCKLCQEYYDLESDDFYINSPTSLKICHIFRSNDDDEFELHTYDYTDMFSQLNIPKNLLREADLYVLKLIQDHPEIKDIRLPSRLKLLLPFV